MSAREAVLGLALGVLATAAVAQQPPAQVGVTSSRELGKVAEQVSVQATAVVEALDRDARTVTLKGPEGNVLTIVAGDEVRNFDQVRVGDRVEVRYTLGLVLQLVKGGGGVRARIENETAGRAPRGEKPSATAAREVMVVADVVAMDAEKQTITLRGPQRTVTLRVRDRAQFENIAVGDQVEATFTEATAVSVQAAPAGK